MNEKAKCPNIITSYLIVKLIGKSIITFPSGRI